MSTVYALLVGIDDYSAHGEQSLRGCLNDVAAVEGWLRRRTGDRLRLRVLRDGEATVAAVTDGITRHLGRCRTGDSALFWFSGHGTRFPVELPEDVRKEATGWYQALACADRPLVDRQLGALLNEVAAAGGHTVAVLDCCYAGGGTRGGRLAARFLPPPPGWAVRRDAPADGPHPAPGQPRHVLLAASRLDQLAREDLVGGRTHGLFTHALLGVLGSDAHRTATCREVLAAAHARVQIATDAQHPVLYPHHPGGPADRPFLGAAAAGPPAPHLLRFGREGWEVDCGGVHGLRPGARPGSPAGTEFTVTGRSPAEVPRTVRAASVRQDRTLVRATGWVPDPERTYPVTLSALELPPAAVTVEAEGPGPAGLLDDALRTAGPDGGPSPLLRRATPADPAAGLLLIRLRAAAGRVGILRRDGSAFVAPLPLGGPADARRVAACLVHLARWHQIRDLENPAAVLGSPVRVEVLPPDGGEESLYPGDGSRELVCAYTRTATGWRAPRLSVQLHNRSHRTLWCALFNLTDSYRSHSVLFPGDFIGPGRTGYALDGDPVQLSLPPGRAPRPGAAVRDWLKLVTAEGELNTVPFHLDALDPDAETHRAAAGTGADGLLRLTSPDRDDRDLGPAPDRRGPGEWTTYTLSLRTVVP
ncbi:caspase family protein [Streptomyces johnsoniae]|uniref:Caspase family protein n=1 Tax=Streptomyces johnsoniae TaxID=3075532 RepID=A0ABU2S8X1_9ACTN|nr:caspase family protein [Streptomyces sp. DSM 41886]MDT0445434.1 caspase family protein [Streptomyces sp. DSM 41886]